MKIYFPGDWYWVAEDGRTYSSARQSLVSSDDAALADWKRDGTEPQRWPTDDAGAQTDEALQAVLEPYGLYISQRIVKQKEVDAARDALMAEGAPLPDGRHVAMDDGTRADLGGMATTALAALSKALDWPDAYAKGWITMENSRVSLPTPEDGLKLAALVGNRYAALRQTARDLKDKIAAAKTDAAASKISVASAFAALG